MSRVSLFLVLACSLHPILATAQNDATASPASLSFSAQLIGTTSASKNAILINNGASSITVTSITTTGDFILTKNLCQNGVKPGTHCNIAVAYSPTPTGSLSGSVTFTDTASNSPQTIALQGIPSAILDFGSIPVGSSSTEYVTIRNTGVSPVSITSISASGYFSSGNPCGSVLMSGASCVVPVTFSPIEGAQANGTLTIVDSGTLSPQIVTLTGYGAASPTPTLANPLLPDEAVVGSTGLTLVIHGSGFVPGSTVLWNGASRSTTFVSKSQISASIPASDLANEGTALVSVFNPAPEGGTSNTLPFTIGIATPSVSFQRTDYAVGKGPTAITADDLNNDGILDLVVADNVAGDVSVLIGKSDGTFLPHVGYPVATNKLAIGDFNEDGNKDVAAIIGSGASSLLFGNGDGTLQPAKISLSNQANAAATGDFNNDGELDIVTIMGNGTQSPGSLYLGDGDGGFRLGPSFYGGLHGHDIAVGDFNGDGNLDIATIPDPNLNSFTVLLGDGTGNLTVLNNFASGGTAPQRLAVADFNRDGLLDIAVLNNGSNTVAVLLGNGDGTFKTPVVYGTGGSSPSAIAIGDMNADGKPDIVVANHTNSFTVLLGKGDGTFPKSKTFKTANYPEDLTIGDFNRDGHLDVAVANWGSNSVSIFQAAPSVGFAPTSLAFGTQTVGSTSYPQSVTLKNTGDADLQIYGVTISGPNPNDFVESSSCPATLLPGKRCSINVAFHPLAVGTRSATLSISSNAKPGPTVKLGGTGI